MAADDPAPILVRGRLATVARASGEPASGEDYLHRSGRLSLQDRSRPDGAMPSEAKADLLESGPLELSSQQAELAFERNLIALDQALLGAIRTSLSLLAFGFAMVLFFHHLSGQMGVDLRVPARNFGLSLVVLGVGLIGVTLVDHRRRFGRLRNRMNGLHKRGLLREGLPNKYSYVGTFAQLLLLIGLLVIAGLVIRIGPFQEPEKPRSPSESAAPAASEVP